MDFLEALDDMIEVGVEVSTWEDAVRAAGSLLVRGGVAREEYVEAMIRTVKELGPYAVIAPGVAIPHARPEDGALRVGFSIVVLRRGVNFGSPNDPVYIVIGFAAVDKKSHLNALQQLADMLSNREFIEALKRARSPGDVKEAVKRFSKRG